MAPHPDRRTVADVQRRLAALGHDPTADPVGVLGDATRVALEAFQRERGLTISGELDAETHARVVEAGWRLGDRLLYLDRPFQRGDDVAGLQEALALLGFNPGRVDGIFGPLTEGALKEFQGNVGLEASGVLSRRCLTELRRLSPRRADRHLVTEARDAMGLLAAHRLVVLAGPPSMTEPVAVLLESELAVVRAGERPASEVARLANEARAGIVVQLSPTDDEPSVSYFASYRAHSVIGRVLAESVAARLGAGVTVRGMSVALLRETVMPAVIITERVDQPSAAFSPAIAAAVVDIFNSAR